jgi:hypothetical protein
MLQERCRFFSESQCWIEQATARQGHQEAPWGLWSPAKPRTEAPGCLVMTAISVESADLVIPEWLAVYISVYHNNFIYIDNLYALILDENKFCLLRCKISNVSVIRIKCVTRCYCHVMSCPVLSCATFFC